MQRTMKTEQRAKTHKKQQKDITSTEKAVRNIVNGLEEIA